MDIFGNKKNEHYDEPQIPQERKDQKDENVIMVNNQKFSNNPYNEENKKVEEDVEEMKNVQQKEPHHRQKQQSVFEPAFSKKNHRLAGNEIPNENKISFFANKLKSSVFGLSEDEADQLMRIDEADAELSNQDVILAKPGTLIKKCWRVKNIGMRQWPKDTRIVSVSDGLYFETPMIHYSLKPGEMMDISVKIYIPEEEPGENALKEYIMRLMCEEFKCYGEPLIATIHLDNNLYDETQFNLPEDSDDRIYPRVTDNRQYTENYKQAKEISEYRKEPFNKVLKDLNNASALLNKI